jgi:hypothetical protein
LILSRDYDWSIGRASNCRWATPKMECVAPISAFGYWRTNRIAPQRRREHYQCNNRKDNQRRIDDFFADLREVKRDSPSFSMKPVEGKVNHTKPFQRFG